MAWDANEKGNYAYLTTIGSRSQKHIDTSRKFDYNTNRIFPRFQIII